MVLDKQGNPLTVASDRRNEIQRCIEIIGWSWGKLGDRIDLKLPSVYAVKNCKRTIPDSDLRWLQDLADAVMAHPRPAPQDDPSPVQGAPVVQAGAMLATADLNPAMEHAPSVQHDVAPAPADADIVRRVRDEIAEQSTVAIVSSITSVYMAAVPGVGPDAMTSEQVAGARWALGELAQQMGVLDLVQDQLRAYSAKAAAVEPARGMIGGGVGADTRQPMA